MPWRGPAEPGEFPTLGWLIGEWIETFLIIPDGPQRGAPYLLTTEMWNHLLWAYRLKPHAAVHPKYPKPRDGFVYFGTQLRRPQKWGKDPFMATRCIAHALGPVQFDGWDADGEPVGRPVDTPWIQLAATSDDQTDNTYKPLYRMLSEGPLADTPGLDIGETRIKLPDGDGWIEPVTSAARSRLGAPITFGAFTEPHLMCKRDGGLDMARAMKRNLTGMGGSWMEATNAWDPSEQSVAQLTAEAHSPGVYLDHRFADLPRVDIADEDAVRERIVLKYGDSARSNGGWVDEDAIYADTQATDVGESEARRYFLDEVTVGEQDAVNALRWAAAAVLGETLVPGETIALGFDGSRYRDATTLIACRIRDGRIFHIRTWEPPPPSPDGNSPKWMVPHAEVDAAVADAFAAYDVRYMFLDPHLWQDYMGLWAGRYPKRVVSFDTRSERLMDRAIERFRTALANGELTHDGHEVLDRHARNAALAKGKRKPREDDEAVRTGADHYLRVVKKRAGHLIDAFVAAILAYAARGQAVEDGALVDDTPPPPAAARSAQPSQPHPPSTVYRPSGRLTL
ncbi:hypothetical protein [Allokutzneria albata]|uniref:Phage terminase-like protein, large subunit, contains N-terminal HTH domain n=1 Tax=Allokutzneria albata TaxID=211114 RepID=A0A1H0DUC5_ALLAB|nr:hypothetical protein [Allokutzneria albata]SDN73601.1 Phage terminase-like protein, large subunit, contains N-terminal HTH domain [Allokutzneria albata]